MFREIVYGVLIGLFIVFLLLFLVGTFVSLKSSKESVQPSSTSQYENTASINFSYATTTATISGYTLEVVPAVPTEPNWPIFIESVRILKGDKVLFKINQQTAGIIPFGKVKRVGDWPDTEILHTAEDFATHSIIDVDGDGTPELAFIEYDGGNGGGDHYNAHVIRLSDPVSVLWEQEPHEGMSTFVDLGKGALKIAIIDTTFGYWETDGASSPAEIVILGLKSGKYVPDTALMRKVPPNDKEIEVEAARWKGVSWGTATGAICENDSCVVPWAYALELIYSGNAESAKKYVDLAYHSESHSPFNSKKDFLKKFAEQIMKSPYYKDLAAYMNLKTLEVSQ